MDFWGVGFRVDPIFSPAVASCTLEITSIVPFVIFVA